MLEQAKVKIKTEMEQSKNNAYVQVVGEFLLGHLDKNPAAAEKIMSEGKTIAKSLDEMQKAARKKKVGNCAILTDQEGFEVVLKYFGIDGAVQQPVIISAPTSQSSGAEFDINLDDLLKE